MVLKYFFRSLLLFAFSGLLHHQTNAQRHINIDEGWKFHFGHAANPEKDFNYSIATIFSKSGGAQRTAVDPRFNDKDWTTVDLPHDWAVELPFVNVKNADVESHGYKPVGGLFPETSIGWYRKHFTVASADSGMRFQIQFDGIFRSANIWVNGFFVGNNMSGYVGCAYDITDYINFDRDNVIAVRVDATQYEGWFYEGAGIYRHVWLNKYNNLHIAHDGVFAYSDIQGNKATVTIETTVENNDLVSSNGIVSAFLTDKAGNVISKAKDASVSLNVNGTSTIKQTLIVDDPHLWSLDDPYLCRVITEIRSNGKLIDQQKLRFGIRKIGIKTNGVFLNGKHVKLFGTNNHQDHAGVGSALPDYLQYYRVRLLKDMGVNAYRTSHNAPTPELLDACDSLGMLVLDEQRLLNSSPEYIDQFERLVRRDRSRACVFMWSIGNEEGWIHTTSVGKRIAQTFIAKQKQ
jgi:beta-galactosidase